jgi:hypothetical protein
MKNNMKTILSLIVTALLLVPGVSFAQVKPAVKVNTQTAVTVTKPVVAEEKKSPETVKTEALSVRKAYVEGQLGVLLTQLTTIYTRTQIAVDRLEDKNIDTKASQADLVKANTALNSARTKIDVFSQIEVSDTDKTKEAQVSATLKQAVQEIESDLQSARQSLITSLANLKAAVAVSIKQ